MQQRFALGKLGAVHIADGENVVIELSQGRERLSMDRFQTLLQFAEARTVAEVHELLVDAAPSLLLAVVNDFARRGLLEPIDHPTGSPSVNILDYLAPVYRTDEALVTIGHYLSRGRCVVLEHAFNPDLAERTAEALAEYNGWRVEYEYATPSFSFRHHRTPDGSPLPAALEHVANVLGSAATKSLVSRLSNLDCSGPLAFGATLYLPGDYALPHSDATGLRNVTFNWYLAKHWSPSWGGRLHWCPSWEIVEPTFNTLVLFNVSDEGRHYVSHVLPTAQGRRYAISSWWLSPTPDTARKPLHEPIPFATTTPPTLEGLRVL